MELTVHEAYRIGFARGVLCVACAIILWLVYQSIMSALYYRGQSFSTVRPMPVVDPVDAPPPPDVPYDPGE